MKIKFKDLQIGDIVSLGDFAFSHAMVKNRTETEVVMYRPYLARPSFTYTGGVITLTGHETITYISEKDEFELIEKTEVK
jgi:hypothetical protein